MAELVYCIWLEIRSTRKGTVGSNPTLSAILNAALAKRLGTGLQNPVDWFDSSTQLHFYGDYSLMVEL